MREVEKRELEYLGYKNPGTHDEVELEILGLELAIKTAEQRVAHLRQALKVAYMKSKAITEAVQAQQKEVEPKDE